MWRRGVFEIRSIAHNNALLYSEEAKHKVLSTQYIFNAHTLSDQFVFEVFRTATTPFANLVIAPHRGIFELQINLKCIRGGPFEYY